MILTDWLSDLSFRTSFWSVPRRVRKRSSRRRGNIEASKRLAAVERLEERLLLTNAPVFEYPTYAESVPEDAETFTWILSVWADDADGDEVSYQFDAASSSAPFAIDSGTGDVFVDDVLDAGIQSEYTLTVEAVDPGGLKGTATLTITVSAVNHPPEADDDSYDVNENDVLIVTAANGLLVNDIDIDGDPLAAHLHSGPSYGTLDYLMGNGSFSYTPDPGFSGYDDFYYYVSDGTNNSEIARVQIEVFEDSTNTPPVANDDSYTVEQDQVLSVLPIDGVLNGDMDADGDAISAYVDMDPSYGLLSLNQDGSFTYEPNPGFTGTDSFTYYLDDGYEYGNSATVTITVTSGSSNTAPTAVNDTHSLTEDTVLTVNAALGVLTNDIDLDEDPLSAILDSGPSNGDLFLYADGSFDYTPNEDFYGTDTFTYRANDGTNDSNVATVTITVNSVNDPPVAVDDMYEIRQGETLEIDAPGVLENDTDPDDDLLSTSLPQGPSNGSLTLNSDGSFQYTPNPGWTGTDTFTYYAYDGVVYSTSAATVTIEVIPNDPPDAVDDIDEYSVHHDTTLSVNDVDGVLKNDTDPEADPLSAILDQGPSNGTLTLNPDGSFDYTPDEGWTGTDSFTYYANDGTQNSSEYATVTIHVTNLPPVAVDDDGPFTVFSGELLTVPAAGVLNNDSDPDNPPDSLEAVPASGPSSAQFFQLNADGSFSYRSISGFVGQDSFTYYADDGADLSAPATVTITVLNRPPIADDDTAEAEYETPLSIDVLANDSDPDGHTLTIISTGGTPQHGTVSIAGNGTSIRNRSRNHSVECP